MTTMKFRTFCDTAKLTIKVDFMKKMQVAELFQDTDTTKNQSVTTM